MQFDLHCQAVGVKRVSRRERFDRGRFAILLAK